MMFRIVSIDQISRESPILIYGSGDAGRVLRSLLICHGWEVSGFLDSFDNGEVDGIRKIKIDEYCHGPCNQVVVCSSYMKEIKIFCTSRGINNAVDAYIIYSLYSERGKILRFPSVYLL